MGKSAEHPCSCCGGTTRTVWGYVYSDGEAHAVYYATWTEQHPEHDLSFARSIGGWGEGANPGEKKMVALECRILDNGPALMVVDAAGSGLANPYLGTMLTRQQVLSSDIKQKASDIIDRIIEDDKRVKEFIVAV